MSAAALAGMAVFATFGLVGALAAHRVPRFLSGLLLATALAITVIRILPLDRLWLWVDLAPQLLFVSLSLGWGLGLFFCPSANELLNGTNLVSDRSQYRNWALVVPILLFANSHLFLNLWRPRTEVTFKQFSKNDWQHLSGGMQCSITDSSPGIIVENNNSTDDCQVILQAPPITSGHVIDLSFSSLLERQQSYDLWLFDGVGTWYNFRKFSSGLELIRGRREGGRFTEHVEWRTSDLRSPEGADRLTIEIRGHVIRYKLRGLYIGWFLADRELKGFVGIRLPPKVTIGVPELTISEFAAASKENSKK
jgi:hypothetical protein